MVGLGPIKTVGVYVSDQAKAVEFYTKKLGFVLRRELPMGPSAKWVEVSPPDAQTCLVLYPRALMPQWEQLKATVVFHCPDVEDTCYWLRAAGVTITAPPKKMAGGVFAMFADPDGNLFGLTSQEIA
jgi:predicted enzyme related to lactoylglutathione lyase